MVDKTGILAIGLTTLALVFGILSCSSNLWATSRTGKFNVKTGLWKICLESSNVSLCSHVNAEIVTKKAFTYYQVVRAMVTAGIIVNFGAGGLGLLVIFKEKTKLYLYHAAAGIDFLAGLLWMVGMAVYSSELHVPLVQGAVVSYSAGFVSAILAWIFSWTGGLVFMITRFCYKSLQRTVAIG